MAITDIPEFAHLSEADIEALGAELEQIRQDIIGSLGERDADYIRNTIRFQRGLEVGARVLLMLGSRNKTAWAIGAGALGVAKIVENMELGHNIMHGQWDWMNDPEIHSTSWEWDNVGTSEHWKQTHNYMHHKYTNILGMDDDVGYGLLRVTRDQRWHPFYYGNLVQHRPGVAVPVGCGHPVPGAGQGGPGARRPREDQAQRLLVPAQGRSSDGQGLRLLPGTVGQVAEVDHDREPAGQRHPQRVDSTP